VSGDELVLVKAASFCVASRSAKLFFGDGKEWPHFPTRLKADIQRRGRLKRDQFQVNNNTPLKKISENALRLEPVGDPHLQCSLWP
jgi:hypothetical protein